MREFIFDLETDNLLDDVTKVHCAVLVDVESSAVESFRGPAEIDCFLNAYQDPHVRLIGHNAIKFDCAVIQKLYGIGIDHSRVLDTMVLGKLVHPDIKATDYERARRWKAYVQATEEGEPWDDPLPREFPGKLIGSHSLKAWGYRLGVHKGEYDGGWEHWSPEMHEYMVQDGLVTLELFQKLMAHQPSPQAVELEHRVAWLCAQIERNGFPFNEAAAAELLGRLVDEREQLRRELIGLFPNWRVRLKDFVPARNNKTKGYIAGVPVERWKEVEFNPSSRDHIADRLIAKYGWKPEAHTEGGKPQVDDEVLSKLPYPEAQKLARSFLLDKRIGQLAEGNQAWLNVAKNGKIHASYNTNGAVTGRATHSHPNISQVPRVSSPFGRECRSLFVAPPGWVLIGADQSGLELRCLASDMAPFDGGAYASVVTQGDVHSTNQEAAGLPTRDNAKTFIYAFLYGAGDDKIGSIVGKGRAVGKKLKQAFLGRTPALSALIRVVKGICYGCGEKGEHYCVERQEKVEATGAARGWIKGIDGRKMPVRSDHAALNVRLQNAGAVICKQWGCDADDELKRRGLKHGWDGDYAFVSWSHDEYQVAIRDDPALYQVHYETDEKGKQKQVVTGLVADVLRETGRAAGDPFNFKCPLDVDTKVGANWAETH